MGWSNPGNACPESGARFVPSADVLPYNRDRPMPPARHATDDAELVRALKALGDLKRFQMVQEIAAAGELSCGQLGERFALAQPTVSHHLKILTDAGILIFRQDAKHHFFSLDRAVVERLVALLPSRLASPRGSNKKKSARR